MKNGKPFTCQHCGKPGVAHVRTSDPKFHRECYGLSLRVPGSKKVPCSNCGQPKEKHGTATTLCLKCQRLSRAVPLGKPLDDQLLELLKRGEQTPLDLSHKTGSTPGQVLDTLIALQAKGHNLHHFGDLWSFERKPVPGGVQVPTLVSDKDGWFKIGVVSDTHICSKQERLAELRDFYRVMETNGISTVLHSGNWIDGEAPFNKHELIVHGMDAQLEYFGEQYPKHQGITTYAVAGDDHEGWYAQREGVDIGRYCEDVMRRGGRTDWKNLGYMEAFIPLQHAITGKQSMYHVIHPGGGSAYATSYTVQKLVESYEGGSKPAIVQVGHYHKAEYLHTRNVHAVQAGCFQDQTIFARKKRLIFTIGGWIIAFRQNPETGAIEEFVSYFKSYFDRGYYQNNRWSLSGPVSQVPRLIEAA